MIMDERTEFADATSLNTGAAGVHNIGDQVDMQGQPIGSANITRDPFASHNPLHMVISVDTTATSGGAATAEFRVVSDAQSTIATDGSATLHGSTGPIPVAQLTAGRQFVITMPPGSYERFLGVQQVTGVAAFTAGKVNAFLTNDPSLIRFYADAV